MWMISQEWGSEYNLFTITITAEIAPNYETTTSTDPTEGQPVQSIHSPSSAYVNRNWSQYFVGFDLPSKKDETHKIQNLPLLHLSIWKYIYQ